MPPLNYLPTIILSLSHTHTHTHTNTHTHTHTLCSFCLLTLHYINAFDKHILKDMLASLLKNRS